MMMRWRVTVPLPLPFSIALAPAAAMATAVADLLECEFSLDAARVFLVACGHVAAVHLDHVRLQVKRCVEDDELLHQALWLCARVMSICEMAFLHMGVG